ncbi:MAG: Tn3 family transposase [Sulfurimonas sp.]|nr:Tn3 family transposase [Sulfurimonas sp.]
MEVDFLSSFGHYNQSKSKLNKNLILARTRYGYGCNLSLFKMGKISKGISENQLDNIKTWYMSEENTNEANETIIASMDKLDIVKLHESQSKISTTLQAMDKNIISLNRLTLQMQGTLLNTLALTRVL